MKKWYQSRLIWIGVSTIALAALSAVNNGADWREIVGAVLGALVVVLRADTSKGVSR